MWSRGDGARVAARPMARPPGISAGAADLQGAGLSPVRPSFGSRLAGVEGMRALAASSIVVYHVWLYSSPTQKPFRFGYWNTRLSDLQYGVTMFFGLSGFLLYRPYVASLLRGDSLPSLTTYLRNRALRILPAYWVILLLATLVFHSVLHRDAAGLHNGTALGPGLLLRNALFIQDYAPTTLVTGIGPAWSLAVEVVFYLLLPLLALGAWSLTRGSSSRVVRRRAALAPAALLLLLGLSGKAAAARLVPPVHPYDGWNGDWHSVIERSFWCQADLFAFGMALAIARIDWEDGLLRLARGWRKLAFAIVLAGSVFVVKEAPNGVPLSYSAYNSLVALICALVLALVVLPPKDRAKPGLLLRVLESPVLVRIGLVSYSLFLWHEPLVRFLREHGLTFPGPGGFLVNILVVATVAGLASALTYRFIEVPALALKARTRAPPARGPSLAMRSEAP